MGAIVLMGWAYTQRERKHVKVVLFLNMFPPRVQTILNFSTLFISLLLFIVITQQSWNIAVENLLEGRQFQILDFPKGPFYFLVPAGAFFICLEFIIQIFEFISRKNKEVD